MSFGKTTTTNQKQSSSSTPVEQTEWKGLRDQLIGMAMKNLGSSQDMSGYEANGITNINNASDAATMARNNILASRGLSASPIAGNADILSQDARAGDIAKFENGIPLLQRDFANQDWNQALQLFSGRPLGTSSKGTMSGVTKESQSMVPSLISGLAGGLGQMIGGGYLTGLFGGGSKTAQGGPTLNPYTGEWE
jgi:hypothetical protein